MISSIILFYIYIITVTFTGLLSIQFTLLIRIFVSLFFMWPKSLIARFHHLSYNKSSSNFLSNIFISNTILQNITCKLFFNQKKGEWEVAPILTLSYQWTILRTTFESRLLHSVSYCGLAAWKLFVNLRERKL